jgi:hypothetical protein
LKISRKSETASAQQEPPLGPRKAVFKNTILFLAFLFCFELGWRCSSFILFQFLIGSFSFYFVQKLMQKFSISNYEYQRDAIDTLCTGRDRITLVVLQTQLALLARESILPLQAGGVMILGYVLELDLRLPPLKIVSILPGIALGLTYLIAQLVEHRVSSREKWLQAANILGNYLVTSKE